MRKSSVALLSTLAVLGLLTGCSKADQKSTTSTKTETSTSATSTDTSTSSDSANKAADTAENKDGDTSTANKDAAGAPAKAGAPRQVNLSTLPQDLVMVTVAGNPIRVRDYQRMLKLNTAQMQLNLVADPVMRASLLEQAKKAGMKLTADEKSRLISAELAARKKTLPQVLKEAKITEKQFDDQISDAGLMMKAANTAVEQQLLSQLVSRELLCKASQSAGLNSSAVSSVSALSKKTNNFAELKRQTGLGQDELREELVKAELAKLQISKLQKNISVSDKDIQAFYDANKKQLSHPERIRLATIVIACPDADVPQAGILSVRAQVMKANPKLKGKELDDTVAALTQRQQNNALILLGEAKASNTDFAKLANKNSADMNAQKNHSGGDMGWKTKQELVKPLVDAVWALKPGTVLPRLVKTQEGFLIIKVTGHEPSGPLALKDVQPLIKAKLTQDKLGAVVSRWIQDQQKTYRIEFTPRFQTIASGQKDPGATH